MNIVKVKDYEEMSEKVCDLFVSRLHAIKKPVFGVATGSTPKGLYKCLVNKYREGKISFKDATFFNLDEYIGLDQDHPSSYTYYMKEKLYNHIDVVPHNIHLPNGKAKDLKKECLDYEQLIHDVQQIDLQILGIGINGHIGFNEPGTPFDSRTDVVQLTDSTIQVNSRFFDSIEEVPSQAITMGIGTIMESKEIVLLISGEQKADALHQTIYGEVTEDFPASVLQRHDNVTVIADAAAFGDA
ncbi:MAG TPA: glucosamine-6-phosphate deaminase [Virgibacillus sp.]|nr:glucosamine-6-phosphate deaminase [Virgibacillus sp.]